MTKFDIARFIANKLGDATPMKLQKLVYYVYVWSLVALRKPLFSANFEAWKFGPVDRDLYRTYKKHGNRPIPISNSRSSPLESHLELIEFIVNSYGHMTALELSKTTHIERPWKNHAHEASRIPDDEIISFYGETDYARNFPISRSKRYIPPSTSADLNYSFDLKVKYDPSYDSIDEYMASVSRAKNHVRLSFGHMDHGPR